MLGRSTLRRSLILLSVGVLVLYNILVFLFSMLFMEPYYLHKVEQTLVNAYETIRDSGEYDLTTISSLEERNLEINIAARETLSMDAYRTAMEGIYTTSVLPETLDEAPMAYKSLQDIIGDIQASVDVIDMLKPVYNFKASG